LSGRGAVPAGLLDAGCASLATLAIGLFAARGLPAAELGAYSLFFSAYVLAAVVPAQLVLIPAGIASVSHPQTERLGLLPQTWRIGGATALTAGIVCTSAAWLAATAPTDVRLALVVTAAACSTLSPLQDYVRAALHLGGRSWRAAAVSVVQFTSVLGTLFVLSVTPIPNAWHPLGSLALANAISLTFAFLVSRDDLAASALPRYRVTQLARFGRWLLLLEISAAGAFFLASVLTSRLAGAEALGHAEAARIAAQPLFVMAVGLSAVLGPKSMEAALTRGLQQARRVSRPFILLLFIAAVTYGGVAAAPWHGNPVATLLPLAYAERGLVGLSVLANLLICVVFPLRSELVAAGWQRPLLRVAALSAAIQTAVSACAAWAGAFARPAGVAASGAVLWLGYSRYRSALYAAAPTGGMDANSIGDEHVGDP
jgi:O-antigen/teichoic acid export membrane protein